tara:strand:- start:270 stop:4052 length:3783 start_codon:yes stop_codon:yes gene_type:complete
MADNLNITSYQSQTFHDILSDIDEEFVDRDPIKEEVDTFIASKGIIPSSFEQEFNKYKEAVSKGEQITPTTTSFGRAAGRAIGETISGIADFSADIGFEGLQDLIQDSKDAIPDKVESYLIDTFDPYHGDDALGTAEYVAGHIGSILIPYTGYLKGVNLASKAMKGFKASTPKGGVSRVDDALTRGQKTTREAEGAGVQRLMREELANIPKVTEKVKRKLRLGQAVKHGLGFAAATTVVEDPDEHIVSVLLNQFPETFEFLKPLSINPNDEPAKRRLDSFLNNLMFEAALAPIFLPMFRTAGSPSVEHLAEAANRMGKSSVASVETSTGALMRRILGDKVAVKLRSFFPTRAVNDEVMGLAIKRDAAASKAVVLIDSLGLSLKQAMKSTYGSSYKDKDVLVNVNDALAGNKKAINSIAKDLDKSGEAKVSSVVEEMRSAIDDLSESISDNLGRGNLKATIDKNVETYLNRSYRIWDDKSWKGIDSLDPQTIDAARNYLKHQAGINPNDIDYVIKYIASANKRSVSDIPNEISKGTRDFLKKLGDFATGTSNPFARRRAARDLAQPLRALWGEYKDPFVNFGKSFEKLSIIKAEQDFVTDLARYLRATQGKVRGVQIGTAAKEIPKGYGSVADTVSERLSTLFRERSGDQERLIQPLQGIHADEAYRDMIKNGLELMAPSSPYMRNWMKLKATSQIMKTVASPATHARNVMGNNFIMLANGMLPMGKGATKFLINRATLRNPREFAKEIAELTELGVLDSGVKAGVLKGSLSDVFQNGMEGHISKTLNKFPLSVGKGAWKKTFKLYQDEDNIYKYLHFQKTKKYMEKAFPNASREEIMRMAAERTRNLMPNYNMVAKNLKRLRRAPVGDFLSFPAEMVRISKNLVKYTLKDIYSGNPVLMKEGFKRLGGFTAVGLGTDIVSDHSRNIFGISQDQAQAIDDAGPPYYKNVPKIFTSPIKRAKDGHIVVDYYNMGPIDPFDYMKYAARSAHEAILSGKKDIDYSKMGLGLWDKLAAPFFGRSMVGEAAFKLANKEWGDKTLSGDLAEAMSIGLSPFEPGFLPFVRRRMQYERSLEQRAARGIPGAVDRYGKSLSEDQAHLWANLSGLSKTRQDITYDLRRNVENVARGIDKRTYKNTEAYKNLTIDDPEKVVEGYVESQKNKIREFKRLRRLVKAFNILTPDGEPLTAEDLQRALSGDVGAGLTKEIKNNIIDKLSLARDNLFIPDILTDADLLKFQGEGKTLPYEEIQKIIQQLNGTRITEE